MQNDFVIVLAWPEGMVASAGSWYDKFASNNGRYRVGHSAIVLINSKTKKSHYFDFGRYHTPKGYGRVRDMETDEDVALIDAKIERGILRNLKEILLQISTIKSTHGEGKMYASLIIGVSFEKAFLAAKTTQKKGMLPYGPFILRGTNCSRFVAAIIKASNPLWIKKLRLSFPASLSPSPKRNVSISNNNYYIVEKKNCLEVKKSKLRAYFTTIERQ